MAVKAWKIAALRAVVAVWAILPAAAGSHAQSPAPPAGPISARAIHLVETGQADSVSLIVDLADEAGLRIEALSAPNRLIIDLDRVVFLGGSNRNPSRGLGPVLGFRAGLFLAGQSRIVIDLNGPALFERVEYVRQAGVVRLVAQISTVGAAVFSAQARADAERRQKQQNAAASAGEPLLVPVPRAAGRALVVIDPGHGGIDPGASAPRGEAEKDIVLAFAKALKTRLAGAGIVDVIMTREDDRFVALNDRVKFARERGAHLFISIHADTLSEEAEVRGASVYTLSERASDAAAARAAEKENRADLLAGVEASDEKTEGVGDILFDLTKRETRLFSQVIARDSVEAFRRAARVHKTPLRAAGFRVLRAPDVPSILIELGYLSNADDLAALTSADMRNRLAGELGTALERFLAAKQDGGSERTGSAPFAPPATAP